MTNDPIFDLGQAMSERVARAVEAEFKNDDTPLPVFVLLIEPQPPDQGVFITSNTQEPFTAHRLLSTGLLMLAAAMSRGELEAARAAWAKVERHVRRALGQPIASGRRTQRRSLRRRRRR